MIVRTAPAPHSVAAGLTILVDPRMAPSQVARIRACAPEHARWTRDPSPPPEAASADGVAWVFLCRGDERAVELTGALSFARATTVRVWLEEDVAGLAWTLTEVADVADIICGGAPELAMERFRNHARAQADLDSVLHTDLVEENLGGGAPAWRAFLREVVRAARHPQAPCLLHGETGTGKDLVARLIHTLDERPHKGDLMVVDCTNLTPELAGSELFGHERGSFTGAHQARKGAVELADRGSLFLDEIGELPLELQARLLRLLQEGTYKRVGSDIWHKASFRLICASHRDLWDDVQQGKFRADLYYRLAGMRLLLPPLRERGDDCLLLAERFLREFGVSDPLDPLLARLMRAYSYPGNVRELRQLMQVAAGRHFGPGPVSIGDMPPEWRRRVHLHALTAADSAAGQPREVPLLDEAPVPSPAPALTADPPSIPGASAAAPAGIWIDTCLRAGMGLREITQRAGELAIDAALALEGQHVRRAAGRLGVTERAIQLRRAALRPPTPAPSSPSSSC